MTTTPQAALLSDEEIISIWNKHSILRSYAVYSTRAHVLLAMRDAEQAIIAKLQPAQEAAQAGQTKSFSALYAANKEGIAEQAAILDAELNLAQAGELPDHAVFAVIDSMGWDLDDAEKDDMYKLCRAALARAALAARKPFTPAQRMRLWQNTEKGKSATSLAAFERIVQATEAAHRIGINGLEVKP